MAAAHFMKSAAAPLLASLEALMSSPSIQFAV